MTNTACDISQMASSFAKLISDYQQYSQKLSVTNPPRVLSFQKWKPPSEGWVKINFDAHVGVALRRGLGVVVRDHNGKVLLTGTRRVEANWNVHITEAAAATYAIVIARRSGYEHVHLEGDSLSVINAITRREQGSSHVNLFFDQIFELSLCFTSFMCSFVRRQGNTAAHMIARWDTGNAHEKICMDPFPPSLLTLVALDD
ncbi:unnamed protein product [Amaranthus hypochondriacus]